MCGMVIVEAVFETSAVHRSLQSHYNQHSQYYSLVDTVLSSNKWIASVVVCPDSSAVPSNAILDAMWIDNETNQSLQYKIHQNYIHIVIFYLTLDTVPAYWLSCL